MFCTIVVLHNSFLQQDSPEFFPRWERIGLKLASPSPSVSLRHNLSCEPERETHVRKEFTIFVGLWRRSAGLGYEYRCNNGSDRRIDRKVHFSRTLKRRFLASLYTIDMLDIDLLVSWFFCSSWIGTNSVRWTNSSSSGLGSILWMRGNWNPPE